jgi:hypothetical protein
MSVDCGRSAKALVLGGLAGSAVLCFCACFAGIAWFATGLYYTLAEQRDAEAWIVPSIALSAGLLTSSLIATKFGMQVGRDWYRNGRS